MHKKIPKICTGCRVSEAKIYLYHSTETAKARPHSEEWQTDTSVQKQWSMHYDINNKGKCSVPCCLSWPISHHNALFFNPQDLNDD